MEKQVQQHEEFTLENGLKVGLCPMKHSGVICGDLKCFHGAVHERQNEEGIAHLMEHVLFAGGTKSFSPEQFHSSIEELGFWSARTSLSAINHPTSFLPEDIETYLKLSSEAFFSPAFHPDIVTRKKNSFKRDIGTQNTCK